MSSSASTSNSLASTATAAATVTAPLTVDDGKQAGGYPHIILTERESALFSKVLSAVSALQLNCTVRVAGGWVRDKLLGLQSDDIDFALDTVTGAHFAASVSAYLVSTGQGKPSSVGTIRSNPDQSKHLETATFVLDGVSIDANRFRDEVYHPGSRIPEVTQSTALEDAQRRDFTINALFYNIHTQCVEDLIGGMLDIKARRIRTPTSAAVTFRDDPLRVLRAARFAARFGYEVDREVREAAASEAVHSDLRVKVTRERVGIELKKDAGEGQDGHQSHGAARPVGTEAGSAGCGRGAYGAWDGGEGRRAVVVNRGAPRCGECGSDE